MKSFISSLLLTLFIAVLGYSAQAGAVVVLDFEGLQDFEAIKNFYDGGLGLGGSGPGPDFDITFSNALALIDSDAGGSGNFGGEPSPDTILFFSSGARTLNVAGGFTTGFSFFYSAPLSPGSITVYDGPNATGNVLAMLNLPLTPFSGAPDPTGDFSPFVPIGVAFAGTAFSIDFGGNAVGQVAFDDVTLGSVTPGVPEPATLLLMGSGLAGLGLVRWRRRRK